MKSALLLVTLGFVLACDGSKGGGAVDGLDASVDGSGGAGTVDAAQPARCADMSAPERDFALTVESGGRSRVANVHVPGSYQPMAATPVVLNFHGFGSTANQQAALSRMIAKSDAEGFIAVHATGFGAPNSWNGGACCGMAASQGIDDVAFTSDLIDALAATLCVDPARVYATGLSNGGFLSHRLACELDDRIAAIAAIAGVVGIASCGPSRPVPVLHFHGTADGIVPYNGNPIINYGSAQSVFDAWSSVDGCTGTANTFDQGNASCVSGTGCDSGGAVTLCTISGGGHSWPGGLGDGADISATDALWDFFVAHPHPSAR